MSILDQLSSEQESKSESLIDETQQGNGPSGKTLEDALSDIRSAWSSRIKEVTVKLKDFNNLIDIQYEIYSLRQEAVDYYYYMNNILQKQIKQYTAEYRLRFVNYKQSSSVRYSSEGVINNLVEGELSQERYTVKILESQAAFMRETIKTIDSIIFGVKNRIDIQKMTVQDVQF